jgi:hypothetical protein
MKVMVSSVLSPLPPSPTSAGQTSIIVLDLDSSVEEAHEEKKDPERNSGTGIPVPEVGEEEETRGKKASPVSSNFFGEAEPAV